MWLLSGDTGWSESGAVRRRWASSTLLTHATTMTGSKVILLLEGTDSKQPGSTYQLVVLQEGEQDWETKILETFTSPEWGKLAVDKDSLAVVGKDKFRPNILKVKLWKEELFRQDIELLEVPTNYVGDVVLESPFLIIGGRTRSLTGWLLMNRWEISTLLLP